MEDHLAKPRLAFTNKNDNLVIRKTSKKGTVVGQAAIDGWKGAIF